MTADEATDQVDDLAQAIAAWRAQDPDPETRDQLDALVASRDAGDPDAAAELANAFGGGLEFGTAGLRGALGPGPNRMNRVVVTRAAAGLADHLQARGSAGGTVLVGYDARHRSADFATDTAEILTAAGFRVLLTAGPTPTPLVAFGIRHRSCVAAVVVTASHNPAADNGYKVYLGDGSQIVPPADAEIAARIAAVDDRDLATIPRADGWTVVGDDLATAYLDRIATLIPSDWSREVRWVYTPLHGVGGALAARAAAAAGFPAATVVAEQAEPDPAFPTVPFPNPEEPGVLDRAIELAREVGADLVIANDPDADRCAVAVPDAHGDWSMLSGDDLGALIGNDALRRGVRGTYACSVVSSSLLAEMALAYNRTFVSTLTGFKWIGRVPGLAFGYEEALGYCCDPGAVADKDGLSAMVTVLGLAARLAAAGVSLQDRLSEIQSRYGLHRTDQLSVRRADVAEIRAIVQRLRDAPPYRLLGQAVTAEDLSTGSAELPPTDAVRLSGTSVSVVVRPSGTEPKLKCYLEVRLSAADSQDLPAAHREADARLERLRAELAVILGLD